ncbi:hypothetical protein HNQ57_002591 [Zhongshania antarctica]|uniref:Uncharacterized protein n=1 Tax=Zhongshania antarctica TaxID=641702 RepID=A0A840R7E0_9GAMM|nr:hypothetical protein [Zhongshania antarctica]MBB5188312.1 hypothetical protein [Zhongshania antarctica]
MEILYILFGWLLGLLSPTIMSSIKQHYDRKKFFTAAKSELSDLQFQLCITGMLLAQRFGVISRDYLTESKFILDQYNGGDKPGSIIQFIDSMLVASEEEFIAIAANLKSEDGVGLSLKNHSTILIDSNAIQISQLPIDLQSKIYEFKNALNIYNQEVLGAKSILDRTYDSNLSDLNHQRLSAGLSAKYADLHKVCTRICGKIQSILDYEL